MHSSSYVGSISKPKGKAAPQPEASSASDDTETPKNADKTANKNGGAPKKKERKKRPAVSTSGARGGDRDDRQRQRRGNSIFQLSDSGLHHLEADSESGDVKPVWLSGPVTPVGFASDEMDGSWSLVLEFPDLRNRQHTCILPRSAFAAKSGEQVVRPLLEEGLALSPGKTTAELVRRYLMQARPEKKFLLVEKPGWYGDVFALNNQVFGDTASTNIIQRADPRSLLRVKGSAEDWITGIGTHANGNKRLQFGISLAFAASLAHLVNAESGMFHLRARSRQGKTTILMAAGSVCGGGGKLGFANSWLMTSNAAEIACAAHNDLLLCLDELKLVDPKHSGNLAYIIASGMGKQRMQKSLAGAPTLSWRTLGLSSGELDLATHVASAQQDDLYGGQLVRFVEIPEPLSPYGMFDRVPDEWKTAEETAGLFAEELAQRAHLCYGAPVRKYLAAVVSQRNRCAKEASDLIRAFANEVASGITSGEVVNVAQRFGLAAAGGVIATKLACTDWSEDEVWENHAALFREWRDARGSDAPADEERAIRQVRGILEAHAARFASAESSAQQAVESVAQNAGGTPRDQLGFRKPMEVEIGGGEKQMETVFLIWPGSWANVFCRGLDPSFVARVLHDRGHLVTDKNKDRFQLNARVPGYSQTKRFYAVRETILA